MDVVCEKRILITGSRDWEDEGAMRIMLEKHGPGTIVHGGARGADKMAERLAIEFDWPFQSYPAQWDRYGKAAGPMRNQFMVEMGADVCLAFPLHNSRGTFDCAARVALAGIPLVPCFAHVSEALWRIKLDYALAGLRQDLPYAPRSQVP